MLKREPIGKESSRLIPKVVFVDGTKRFLLPRSSLDTGRTITGYSYFHEEPVDANDHMQLGVMRGIGLQVKRGSCVISRASWAETGQR